MKASSTISPEFRTSFQEAVRRAMSGQRDPAAMKAACEHMDAVREQICREHGVRILALA